MKKSLGAKTIALPLPAWVIAVYDAAGRPNAMTAAWTGVCCSQPPCVYFAARDTRHTFTGVQAHRAFSVNIPGQGQAAVTDYLGIASGSQVDKFAAAGLTAVRSELVDAPYIAEFPLVLECRLVQAMALGTHTMFIGEVADVKCDANMLDATAKIDPTKLRPFCYSSADGHYYAIGDQIGQGYKLGKNLGLD